MRQSSRTILLPLRVLLIEARVDGDLVGGTRRARRAAAPTSFFDLGGHSLIAA